MIASITFNRNPQSQHAYQQFVPSTYFLEEEHVAPGSFMPVFICEDDQVRVKYGRWGMPAQEVAAGEDRLTASAQNIFQRPGFGEAIRLRRCLIPVDSFRVNEMITMNSPEHEFAHNDGELFCLAGIYAYREGAYGEEALGIAVVTTSSPLSWRGYSHTMPLMLAPEAAQSWIDPNANLNHIADLFHPAPAGMLQVRTVNPDEAMPAILHEQAA